MTEGVVCAVFTSRFASQTGCLRQPILSATPPFPSRPPTVNLKTLPVSAVVMLFRGRCLGRF